MNYFAHQTAAQRYAQARPDVHPLFIDKIKSFIDNREPIDNALDVGCGTGQSSVALTKIAKRVTATDISAEMLEQATPHEQVEYLHVAGEELAFDDASFDMLTVGLAFHWLDHERFMPRACRMLREGGWLMIYNSVFVGKMAGNEQFYPWVREVYVERYPTPARRRVDINQAFAERFGFIFIERKIFSHEVTFSAEQLVAYLMTQSNVINAVEQGEESIESVEQWLSGEVERYFTDSKAAFEFSGSIWYLKKCE